MMVRNNMKGTLYLANTMGLEQSMVLVKLRKAILRIQCYMDKEPSITHGATKNTKKESL